jgi:ADP-heptose:LPS heptosyltransferase
MPKRPPLDTLAKGFINLSSRHDFELILTGAPFEKGINDEFIEKINALGPSRQSNGWIRNLAGTKDLLELAGVISACDLFISSDSGPYHMSVGLKLPTLLWLEVWEPSSIHQGVSLKHLYKPTVDEFVQTFEELLPFANPPNLNKEA